MKIRPTATTTGIAESARTAPPSTPARLDFHGRADSALHAVVGQPPSAGMSAARAHLRNDRRGRLSDDDWRGRQSHYRRACALGQVTTDFGIAAPREFRYTVRTESNTASQPKLCHAMKTARFAKLVCHAAAFAAQQVRRASFAQSHLEPLHRLMKTRPTFRTLRALLALSLAALAPSLLAQLTIPGADGSDGALNVTTGTNTIDLSRAVTGLWDGNNSANAGRGIYDPSKWAVVFKYSSVNISSNAVVTFANHPTHAPVVWLVSSNVTINGTINLSGQNYNQNAVTTEPGPGGFRGGAMFQPGLAYGGGFGPGGYSDNVGAYSATNGYGNPQIVPLIGGSGGSSAYGPSGTYNGGAGGGAILIAASRNVTINGSVIASGGGGTYFAGGYSAYPGSGGAVRIITDQILGSGVVQALGGAGGGYLSSVPGRIRIEANSASGSLGLSPGTVALAPSPLVIWPAASAPTVKIISIAGQSTPADPHAAIDASGDDVVISSTVLNGIVLQTSNFPINGMVNVYVKPRNGQQSILQASYVSGNTNSATWQVQTTLPLLHTVIQARAVSP